MHHSPFARRYPIYAEPDPGSLSPLEEACEAFAKDAHKGQLRGKEVAVPYINHCYLVHRLLKGIGITDPIILSVALLHDVLEEHRELKKIPDIEKRAREFQTLLHAFFSQKQYSTRISKAHGDIGALSRDIAERVKKLTNPEIMPEGKRIYQADKIRFYSSEGKLVKSADQLATVIEDIFLPPKHGMNKAMKFAAKAWANAKICALEERPQHQWLFNAVKVAAQRIHAVINAAGDKRRLVKIHGDSSVDKILHAADPMNFIDRSVVKVTRIVDNFNTNHEDFGMTNIGLTPNGEVRTFTMLVTSEDDEHGVASKAVLRMLDRIEGDNHYPNYVTVYPRVTNGHNYPTRKFKMYRAVPLNEFIEMCRELPVNAMSSEFAQQLNDFEVSAKSAEPSQGLWTSNTRSERLGQDGRGGR